MHFRLFCAVAVCILGLSDLNPASAAPQSLHPSILIRFLLNAASGSKPVRLVKDPRDNTLYYLEQNGSIHRINLNPGSGTSSSTLVYDSTDHTINSASGLAIGSDGTIYVVGNTTTNDGNSTFAIVMKGVTNVAGGRTWSSLVRTEAYPLSKTSFDHLFNGMVVSPDGQFIYLNSGARTDHGEEQSVQGVFPGMREVPLTAKIFKLPTSGSDLFLSNNLSALQSAGYIYSEGVRNTYDLAFAPNGDLFGTENGPDRDMPDELNWLREGLHYGFPWRLGGADNPQQFPDYDPATDRLLDPRYVTIENGYYHNDPSFPLPPTGFAEPVINLGPDADSYRDPVDGSIKDSSEGGQTLATFTAHRSPLGLVFDTAGVLSSEFRNHGFMLSWSAGDPNGTSVAGPFKDASQDLVDLDLTKLGDTNYQARVTRLVGGFSRPIDADIVTNRIYVIEYGGSAGIWEITLPLAPSVTIDPASMTNIVGSTATFTAMARGGVLFSYQWRFNGAPITDATNDTLVIASVRAADDGYYDVVIVSDGGTATSDAATLFVPPDISAQPQSRTTECATGSALFSVTATGAPPLAYQWRFEGSPISAATDSILTLDNPTVANVGGYDVVVSSFSGSVTSKLAFLAIVDTTLPVITCSPDLSVFSVNPAGTTVGFSVTAQDSCSGAATLVCVPTSGAVFTVGATTVECTATDASDNHSTCSFTVTVVLNHAPVVGDDIMGVLENHPRAVPIEKLLLNDTDLDGDPLTVIAVTPLSTNGGVVTLSSMEVLYTPIPNFVGTDLFTYTASDGRGGLATASVVVHLLSTDDPSLNLIVEVTMRPTGLKIHFTGIPCFAYSVERSTDLRTWASIGAFTVSDSGTADYEDTHPPSGAAFYRTVMVE